MNLVPIGMALEKIKSGMTVFIQGGAATPLCLLEELARQAPRLTDVELVHLHIEGNLPHLGPEARKSFKVINFFVGSNIRPFFDFDRVDYLPVFLREIPSLFEQGLKKLDAGLFHVSPPDRHGYCSLGVSVDVALAAWRSCEVKIVQVNPQMPRVHGDGFVKISEATAVVEIDSPLMEGRRAPIDQDQATIGKHVASLIEDGAALQVGIGGIPDAVLRELKGHQRLGIHSEMWSDGMLDLIRSGAVDNSNKQVHRGKTVSGFLIGSRDLYDFVHENPSVIQLGIDYVNSPFVISRNPKATAINSAVAVDLTGQICADSVGPRIISGVGGQMDFMLGSSLSKKGKSVIAMKSRTARGTPKIVPTLPLGSGVVTTRPQVQFVVTEQGVADLRAKTLGERARDLIGVAHPEDRESLEREWFELKKINI